MGRCYASGDAAALSRYAGHPALRQADPLDDTAHAAGDRTDALLDCAVSLRSQQEMMMSKTVADVQGRRSRTMAQFADSVVICSRTRFSVATGMSANGTSATSPARSHMSVLEPLADMP